jgi:DNA glycosylase AlkZ-like
MLAQRLTAQMLAGDPAPDPVTVTRRLLAIQAQDPRGARLAIRARSQGLLAADVDVALTDERSLLISWLNRGTLHLVCSEDYRWLHALTTPQLLTASTRRLAQEGVDPASADRGVDAIVRALADEGPLIRDKLAERVRAVGVRTEGQALVHLLFLATVRGLIVRGPMVGKHHAYVLVADWLGEQPAIDRDQALAELARRFLAGHGPADDRDLAGWAGVPLRAARRGLSAVASELVQSSDGLVDLARRPVTAPLPAPQLLGSFDPVLHGWKSREPILDGHQGRIVSGGIFRPFMLVRGRAAGLWTLRGMHVVIEPFGRLARTDSDALRADAEDVVRYFAGSART